MRAFRLCLTVIAVLLLASNVNVSWAQCPCEQHNGGYSGNYANGNDGHSLYGSASYGYTATGFQRLERNSYGGEYYPSVPQQCRPYKQSYYQYSPLRYGTDPCEQWTLRGCVLGFPVWAYTPTLIPPKPNEHFRCCHNCGLCTPETPCCPLCNLNGCCDRERAIEAGENVQETEAIVPENAVSKASIVTPENSIPVQQETQAPTPAPAPVAVPANDPTSAPVSTPAENPTDTAQPSPLPPTAQAGTLQLSQVSYTQSGSKDSQPVRYSRVDVRSSRGVIFTIWAPNQAKVFVNGYETKKVGSKRTFASLNLKPGLRYQYVIDAVVEKDGKTYSESQTLTVKAGDVKTVAFAFPELNLVPSDDWSGEGF